MREQRRFGPGGFYEVSFAPHRRELPHGGIVPWPEALRVRFPDDEGWHQMENDPVRPEDRNKSGGR